jgi:HEAT repeat protein
MRTLSKMALAAVVMLMPVMAAGCGGWPWWEKREAVDPALYAQSGAFRVEQVQAVGAALPKATLEQQNSICANFATQMQNEPDPLVRWEIVKAVANSQSPQAAAILYGGMKDPYQDVRIACCKAWGKRGGPEASRVLGEALASDLNMDVRLAAARALGNVKDPAAVASLGLALDDTNPAMQYRAVESLKTASGKDLGDNVEAWRQYARSVQPGVNPAPIAERPYRIN